jgi:hypothetical protein
MSRSTATGRPNTTVSVPSPRCGAGAALSSIHAAKQPKPDKKYGVFGRRRTTAADQDERRHLDLAWPSHTQGSAAHHRTVQTQPCSTQAAAPAALRCVGRTIDYTKPGSFVAGHIVSRRKAKLLGWTEDMINARSNLQPECRSCSNKTGAREGQQAQRAKLKRTNIMYPFNDSHRW